MFTVLTSSIVLLPGLILWLMCKDRAKAILLQMQTDLPTTVERAMDDTQDYVRILSWGKVIWH